MSQPCLRASAAIAIAATLLSTACGGGDDEGPEASVLVDEKPAETTPAATDASPATDPPPAEVVGAICATISEEWDHDPIDCSEPHDAELAGFATTTSAPNGGDPEFGIELMGLCSDAVAELADRPTQSFGVDVGSVYDADNGATDNVECWAEVSTAAALTGSLHDVDLATALGDYSVIVDMDPGSCYLEPEQGYDVGTVTDCTDPATVQLVSVISSRLDEYDRDAITDEGFALCQQEIDDATFDLIGSSYTFISPREDGWRALDRRTIICLMERGDDDIPQADADQPCAGTPADVFPAMPCDELHASEFVGVVPSPVDVLPEDLDEAAIIGTMACLETVTAFSGRDKLPEGFGAAFSFDSGLGEEVTGDLSCYLSTDLPDALLGSVADIGFDAALQKIIVPEAVPGSCFLLGEASFFLADVADCGDADALMFIGAFDLADGAYPGEDAIRETRAVECARLLDESGLAADPASLSGSFPGARDWATGHRLVSCDAAPI